VTGHHVSTPDPVGTRDRMRWLRRHATMWLLAMVLLVVALAIGVGWSFGLFTASSPNPENTVSAGSMSQVNSADDAAIMSGSDMVPGDVIKGSATIENVGDASGDFTLTSKDVTGAAGPNGGKLVSRLRLVVRNESTLKALYTGRLDQLDLDLGRWAPGESRSYAFEVSFPEGTDADDNKYQLAKVTATFQWHAVQAQ
jgi:hypothetical protein